MVFLKVDVDDAQVSNHPRSHAGLYSSALGGVTGMRPGSYYESHAAFFLWSFLPFLLHYYILNARSEMSWLACRRLFYSFMCPIPIFSISFLKSMSFSHTFEFVLNWPLYFSAHIVVNIMDCLVMSWSHHGRWSMPVLGFQWYLTTCIFNRREKNPGIWCIYLVVNAIQTCVSNSCFRLVCFFPALSPVN